MKIHLLLSVLSVLFILAACSTEKPISKMPPNNNQTYAVEYLFEHEGCKVYRFRDNGNYVYFTNCRGEAITYPDSATVIRNSTNLRKN